MRKFLALCGALLCCSAGVRAQVRNSSPGSSAARGPAAAAAQSRPYASGELHPWQLGVNYEYVRFKIAGGERNLHGFHTSLTRYANDWLGLEAAVGGAFDGNSGSQRTRFLFYGGGPRLAYRRNTKMEPWVHAVFGGAHLLPRTALGSANAFAYTAGGGLDLKVSPRVYWRVQADYLRSQFFDKIQENYQVGTGIVINF